MDANHRSTTMEPSTIAAGKRKREDQPSSREQEKDVNKETTECLYLDTVQRSLLDFDLEPACSVSLETGPHIYACCVCGAYFRGRGPHTPAYTHSVEASHFVFVHLSKGTFYCLPDDYEIHDPSLADIRAALHPVFTPEQVASIDDTNTALLARDLFGKRYLPGFVGLNNLSKTDGISAVVQALAHVPPLRDFFLLKRHDEALVNIADTAMASKDGKASYTKLLRSSAHHLSSQRVTHAFGELVRKLWSNARFKSHVDPHIFIQAVSAASRKRFQVGQQVEAGEFMAWLLHQFHVGTGGGKKPGSSIIHKLFQGQVRVTVRQTKKVTAIFNKEPINDDRGGSDNDEGEDQNEIERSSERNHSKEPQVVLEETTTDSHFLQLTLDIPEKPLFRDEDGGLVIPQESLVTVLKKFDGVTFSDALTKSGMAQRKRYQLLQLPNYLILHLARFKTNQYSREKNPTIVAFPVKNLDLSSYVHRDGHQKKAPTEDDLRNMSVRKIVFVFLSCQKLI